MKKDVKEEQIQTLLSEFEGKVRRYVDAIKNGPQTFDHVERTYEAIFNGGGADIVKIGLATLEDDAGISFGKYSNLLLEKICLLGAHVPAKTCTDLLRRLCGIQVSVTTTKNALREMGASLHDAEEAACHSSAPNFNFSSPEAQKILKNRAYLELDGCMLNSTEIAEWAAA